MLVISGASVERPITFQVDVSDIDGETNRNAKGNMIRDRIAVKRKISITWGALTQEQISVILNAVSSEFFECTYLDPALGTTSKTFYVGDRSAPLLTGDGMWKGLSMNFVEQ